MILFFLEEDWEVNHKANYQLVNFIGALHILGRRVVHIEWMIYRKILMGAKSHIDYSLSKIRFYK